LKETALQAERTAQPAQAAAAAQAGLSCRLADFVERTQWGELPVAVRHEAARALVNYFAAALAGCADPAIQRAAAVFARLRAGEDAGLIGRRERTDILNAAALNAMSANVHDFDDTHLPTIIHPTAPVAAALFALAESAPLRGAAPLRGQDLLLALVLGVEIECRLGLAVSPGHYRRGWHITSTCGVFGAAAAAAKVLHLDARRLVWAFGHASAQASGVIQTLGTMAKSLSVGNAARSGVLAALLAGEDFSGPDEPIDGERGFLRVTTDHPDPDAAVAGLGQDWALLSNGYKPYPCGIVLHAAVDACLQLRQRAAGEGADLPWTSADIERIELVGHPLLRERTDRPLPGSGREAQVSAQHALAVTLARGSAGLADFSDASIADPALQGLRARVVLLDDPGFAVQAAQVTLVLRSGRTVSRRVDAPRGSPGIPLSDAELGAKLRELAAYGASGVAAQPLLDELWALERAPDAAAPMRAACVPGGT
jgi:2-methylcitrate dehydratase PrpD